MIQQEIIDWTVDPPWEARDNSFECKSVDGTIAAPFTAADIDRVIAFGSCLPKDWRATQRGRGQREFAGWDGEECGVAKLTDGRFVAWETWWGPTGSGFCAEAYGGDAVVAFGASKDAVLPHISEKARESLEWLP